MTIAKDRIFVGRTKEIEQFKKVLEDQQGQAVLVVGNRGMGKTWLLDKMMKIASSHPTLKCGCMRYEVTETVPASSSMAVIMDDAYEASRSLKEGFKVTGRNKKMWKALVSMVEVIGGTRGKALAELVLSFHRDDTKDTRLQFFNSLVTLSGRLRKNERAVIFIDPEKYMQKGSASDWRLIVRDLPERIKFVFAQRTEDQLVTDPDFNALGNLVYISDNILEPLNDTDVEELVRLRASDVELPSNELNQAVLKYHGHPYAIQAGLNIAEKTKQLKELPVDPTPEAIAKSQWDEVCKISENAVRLFETYAILEVAVPDDVAEAVSGLKATQRKRIVRDKFLGGLLREEAGGQRIYHSILTDYVLEQISEAEKKEYHARAVEAYRVKLKKAREEKTKPDELAAMRLPEHVVEAEGPKAFVNTFVNECTPPLLALGLLDAAISFSQQALEKAEESSEEKAALLGNLGAIYKTRGELDKAEEMHNKALEIAEKLGLQDIVAGAYGNLGLIYRRRGELDKAEQMHNKALEIAERLGLQESIANQYAALGLVNYEKGDLNEAEKMHLKGLEIEEKIGRLEGVARQSSNLGLIYQDRGELDKAEDMHNKSLEIDRKLGLLEGMASDYGNLGVMYRKRGDLDKAEEMYNKALQIDEKLGLREGMARDFGNLGLIYEMRGDAKKARELWEKARDLYKKIGMPHEVKKMEEWIEGLNKTDDGGQKAEDRR